VFVLGISASIFVIVFTLLAYDIVKCRKRTDDGGREPTPTQECLGVAPSQHVPAWKKWIFRPVGASPQTMPLLDVGVALDSRR
jgi:hypothetical protein